MNNTEKLLRAFIAASGYEVEETPIPIKFYGEITGASVTVDYKVTKKKKQVCFDIDSPKWTCIVDYIISSRHKIEGKENDFGMLKPMLDFMRGC